MYNTKYETYNMKTKLTNYHCILHTYEYVNEHYNYHTPIKYLSH